MRKKGATVQDIADALRLSRTTVSKALNRHDTIPQKTIETVLAKAAELQYKQFAFLDITKAKIAGKGSQHNGTFAMLAHVMPDKFHIGSSLMTHLEQEISQEGYSLTIHILKDDDIRGLQLPNNFSLDHVDAIICMELFDKAYSQMLCTLGKPVLFTDMFADTSYHDLNADLLMMENRYNTEKMVSAVLQENNLSSAGFIGDIHHCLSFYERWEGFCSAMAKCGRSVREKHNIIDEDDSLYGDDLWLTRQLENMPALPELFVCANDSLALHILSVLKSMGISVPDQVLLCGFDDMPEARIIEPQLTTVHIPRNSMGILAAQRLLSKITNPALPCTTTYVQTKVKFRASTKKH